MPPSVGIVSDEDDHAQKKQKRAKENSIGADNMSGMPRRRSQST